MKTGKLEKIDTREVWPREDEDFTPWLAKEENLEQLSEAVQMDLSLEEKEQRVGSFRADIVCRDQFTENVVLIENQFNKTDHKHLGQILTYAAGTKAKSIIWIAENFTEEHRATLDWLNDKTDDEFNFLFIGRLIKHKGIINIGGKKSSVHKFAKQYNKKILGVFASQTLKRKIPLNHSMSLLRLKKILK